MPTSLALAARGARLATLTVPQYRYARMAMRYGPTAARAGGRIAKWAYRRYKTGRRSGYSRAKRGRFSKTRIGEVVGSSNSKPRIQVRNSLALSRASRTLYSENLTVTDQGGNRNERERGVINCRGFRICMAIRNNISEPLYVNVAVVSPKNAGEITSANFFRASGQSRGSDFDNSKTGLEFHCLPLNTDKFAILKHKRYRLNNEESGSNITGKNYMNIDWYIKLKRQLRYDDTTTTSPIDGAVYLLYWCDRFFGQDSNIPVGASMSTMERHIMYFHDTKR